MEKKEEHTLTQTILEAPPAAESPGAEAGLFSDSVGVMTAKLAVTEGFLNLLNRDSNFNDFTRDLLLTMMKVVQSEAGSLFELDHRNQSLFFRSVVGRSSDKIGNFQVPLGQGIVGYVAESRQPLIVSNVNENKRHLKAIQNAVGFEAKNMIAVPIIIRGKTYGVVELLNRVGEESYTPADIDLMTYCCEMAAKAIEVRLMIAWALRRANGPKKAATAETSEARPAAESDDGGEKAA